jgi:hypothetical protein
MRVYKPFKVDRGVVCTSISAGLTEKICITGEVLWNYIFESEYLLTAFPTITQKKRFKKEMEKGRYN